MTTLTTRYGLNKIVLGSDNVDVLNDFNANWDSLDTKLGTQVCTSSTRPSSPVQGMLAFETDTSFTRVYKGAAWQTAGNAVSTSGSRPANPIQGDEFYETDTGYTRSRGASAWNGLLPSLANASPPANPLAGDLFYANNIDAVVRYTGSAWKITSIIPCTSSTRPSNNIAAGVTAYETDTTRFIVYNGTSWEQKAFANFVCTSGTHPASPFTGLEIYETDSGLNAVYNGTNYLYNAQQIGPTQILGSTTANITFSSIPAVNRIMLAWRTRSSASGGVFVQMQLDGVSTSSYLWNKNSASGGTASNGHSGALVAQINIGISDATTTSYFGNGFTVIDGWASATGFATCAGVYSNFSSTTADDIGNAGGQYNAVGPHTSLKVFLSANSFAAGSEFSLYALP